MLKNIGDNLYYFKAKLVDDDIDRDNERFTKDAVRKMADMFIGKVGLAPPEVTQICSTTSMRIFDTELRQSDSGALELIALISVRLNTASQAKQFEQYLSTHQDLSVSCSVLSRTCSICGKNALKEHCKHEKGKIYGKYMKRKCIYELSGVTDVYEWTFVENPENEVIQ